MIETTARKYLNPLFEIEDKLQDLIVEVAADYADTGPGLKLTANLLKVKRFLDKATTWLSKDEEEEEETIRSILEAKKRANNLQNKLTAPAESAPLVDTAPTSEAAPAPAPTPEKEVTPAPTADGEKAEKKAAPKATPPRLKIG